MHHLYDRGKREKLASRHAFCTALVSLRYAFTDACQRASFFRVCFSRFLWSYCLQFVTIHSSKLTYCFFLERIKTEKRGNTRTHIINGSFLPFWTTRSLDNIKAVWGVLLFYTILRNAYLVCRRHYHKLNGSPVRGSKNCHTSNAVRLDRGKIWLEILSPWGRKS